MSGVPGLAMGPQSRPPGTGPWEARPVQATPTSDRTLSGAEGRKPRPHLEGEKRFQNLGRWCGSVGRGKVTQDSAALRGVEGVLPLGGAGYWAGTTRPEGWPPLQPRHLEGSPRPPASSAYDHPRPELHSHYPRPRVRSPHRQPHLRFSESC